MSAKGIAMKSLLWRVGGWLLMFSQITFSWFIFRAIGISQAFDMIKHVFTCKTPQPFKYIIMDASLQDGFGLFSALIVLVFGTYMFWIEKKYQSRLTEFNDKPVADTLFMAFTAVAIIVFGAFTKESFIYFQF
jgi:hypothetical protein